MNECNVDIPSISHGIENKGKEQAHSSDEWRGANTFYLVVSVLEPWTVQKWMNEKD